MRILFVQLSRMKKVLNISLTKADSTVTTTIVRLKEDYGIATRLTQLASKNKSYHKKQTVL